MNNSSLALPLYLESIEALCRSLDRDALQQCILALAKQVKPEDRQVFLQNFRTLLPGNAHREIALATLEESLLHNEIEDIRKELVRRLESFDDDASPNSDEEWHRLDFDPKLVN